MDLNLFKKIKFMLFFRYYSCKNDVDTINSQKIYYQYILCAYKRSCRYICNMYIHKNII